MPLCGDAMNLPFLFLDEKMDIGVVSHSPNEPRDDKAYGSANLKPQRSGLARDSDNSDWRPSKMPRPAGEVEGFSAPFGRSNLWPSPEDDDGQKMLSFSSEEHRSGGGGSSRSIAFSVCQDEYHSRTGGGMRGPFARLKGPFSPSQWMELEHQALIYKHIMANVPVPSSLLLPLKRSLYSYGPPGSYASNLLGWGPFHLGFSGSNDPEPGRCRRTDGKKWRCSRDAVPDQKYCERHINRGRHRSRKPVEGHTSGHATRVAVASSSASAPKVPPAPTMHSASASTDNLVNRSQGFQGLSLVSPVAAMSHKDVPPFSVPKPTHAAFQESEFGIVSSDSLLNPSERISYMNTTTTNNSFLPFEDKEESNNQTHHFIDDWPKDQSESDWTQLSMSIPTPRLSRELDPMIRMSLGVGHNFDGAIHKQPSWSPVTWGGQVGGPLGEVLSSQVGSSPTGVLQRTTFVSLSNNSSSLSSPRTSGDNKRALDCDLLGSALV